MNLLKEYSTASLRQNVAATPRDSLYNNLQRFLARMQKLRTMIPSVNAIPEQDFIVRLITGVEGYKEFALTIYKPPTTIQGFISDLNWAASQASQSTLLFPAGQACSASTTPSVIPVYYTDRM